MQANLSSFYLSFSLNIPRHWTQAEISTSCKAYARAMLNLFARADQDFVAFFSEVTRRMEEVFPTNIEK